MSTTMPSERATRPRGSKLMSLHDAVREFVHDGDSVHLGYTSWASALEREIARQQKRDLTPIATVGSLMLPLAGCASRLVTSYFLGARSPWFMERLRAGEFQIEEYTNQTIALMFMAGALGIPFIPTRSLLGSDFVSERFHPQPYGWLGEDELRVIESPFGGQPVVALPALRPDVSCVHVQWADEEGNAAFWGGAGEVRWGLWASERIIISADEIVPSSVLRSDPHRTTIPGVMVDAVVHLPYGALPWGLPGYYGAADRLRAEYLPAMRTAETFEAMMAEWVYGCATHDDFLAHVRERFGDRALEELNVTETWEPERPIRYGWRARS